LYEEHPEFLRVRAIKLIRLADFRPSWGVWWGDGRTASGSVPSEEINSLGQLHEHLSPCLLMIDIIKSAIITIMGHCQGDHQVDRQEGQGLGALVLPGGKDQGREAC